MRAKKQKTLLPLQLLRANIPMEFRDVKARRALKPNSVKQENQILNQLLQLYRCAFNWGFKYWNFQFEIWEQYFWKRFPFQLRKSKSNFWRFHPLHHTVWRHSTSGKWWLKDRKCCECERIVRKGRPEMWCAPTTLSFCSLSWDMFECLYPWIGILVTAGSSFLLACDTKRVSSGF